MRPKNQRVLGLALLVLSHVLGPASLLLWLAFLLRGPLNLIDMNVGETASLCTNACLSLMFFIQHSYMVRRRFKERIARVVRMEYHPALYAAASGVALLAVFVFWQGSPHTYISLQGIPRLLVRLVFALSIAGFIWGLRSLGTLDTFGRQPILRSLRNENIAAPIPFTVRGPYRWVRHPLYLFCLIMIWASPAITADRLLYDILWSGWIVLGAMLEERDLAAVFGQAYRDYQTSVPMLIPFHIRPIQSMSRHPDVVSVAEKTSDKVIDTFVRIRL